MSEPDEVRRNPVTGSVALRTDLPDQPDFFDYLWIVATKTMGPRFASDREVADWDVIYLP